LFFNKSFGWGQQFSYDGFNIALISIVFVMALSFLGVWEIPIPGFAGSRNAQEMAAKEGSLGAFIKGMITTLLATPCSGPFLGTAVGFALISSPAITFAIFTAMGLGMAAPYLLIGARPSLMKFMPKPGPWMDTFKQVMGFVLVGTVLWLLVPVDAHLIMPTLILLTGLAAACWWIGRTPGYAELNEKLKAWGIGVGIAAIVGWLAFAMPQVTDPLPWRKFAMAKFVDDVNENKTVLVEFTAEWCATCKALKAANLDRSKTKASINSNNVVVYEVDIDRINEQEREFFMRMQPSGGVPLVAIFPAGKKYQPISFGSGYTQSQILEALKTAGPSGAK
jgi:thiol:disulfide interchange protein